MLKQAVKRSEKEKQKAHKMKSLIHGDAVEVALQLPHIFDHFISGRYPAK